MTADPGSSNERWRQRPGTGDPWAEQHRELPGFCSMQDIDGVSFVATDDRLFLEYTKDAFANRAAALRSFAVVAVFDRKETLQAALSRRNTLPSQFTRWLCLTLAQHQPAPPRLFYVFGKEPPWQMAEVDLGSGEIAPEACWLTYGPGEWQQAWRRAGLEQLRETLTRWLRGLSFTQ